MCACMHACSHGACVNACTADQPVISLISTLSLPVATTASMYCT
jgi:hypothetical protein